MQSDQSIQDENESKHSFSYNLKNLDFYFNPNDFKRKQLKKPRQNLPSPSLDENMNMQESSLILSSKQSHLENTFNQ